MQERMRVMLRSIVAITITTAFGLLLLLLGPATLPFGGMMIVPIFTLAYLWGLVPGLVATASGVITVVLLSDLGAPTWWMRPLVVLVVGTGVTIATEALHRARARVDAARRAAEDSNLRFARLFHASPVAMCATRLDDGTLAEVNAAFTALFGFLPSDVVGKTARSIGLVFQKGSPEAVYATLREHGAVRDEEVQVDTPRGPRHLLVSSQRIELGGVHYSLATFVDETERHRAEAAAEESRQRFQELTENIEEVFWVCSARERTVEYVSAAYERVFQRKIADLARDSRDWINAVHHDDRPRLKKAAESVIEGRSEVTFRVVLPDGGMKTLRSAYFPIRDTTGAVVRIAGITADVTAQQALEEQVRQAQKLESLGMLAGGVAHDFNNILAVIGSSVGMLEEVVPASDKDLVAEIEKAVKRGASLTRQLLAFSRRQVIAPVVLDVNQVVEETRKMLRRMVGEDIKLACSLDPELRHVMMDSGALVQVMMNLAVNARDAMPRGGELTMTTRNAGDDVLLEVADTGCGMPPDVQARIFEPFFTTKGVGKGTGLGLSVVHGIVQQAGGRIEVRSQVGVGTTFSVYFPATFEATEVQAEASKDDSRGEEKVLLVDDDVYVRTAAARALRTHGYTVLEAGDGNRALELVDEHGPSLALLVTDVVMPGMDGRQLVEAARTRRPSLKVLYTSGYTDDAVLLHGIQHDRVAFLEKPFRAAQLASKVRRTIDVDAARLDAR